MTPAEVIAGKGRWCVIEGDCLEVMAGMEDGCCDHVITDPPYDAHTHGSARTNRNGRGAEALPINFAPTTAAAYVPGVMRLASRWQLYFCPVEWLGLFREMWSEWYVRGGIWDRLDGMPQISGDRPAQPAEGIAILHAGGRGYKRWNGGGKRGMWSHGIERNDRQHPTQKPLPLMLDLVRDFTDPDDLILDPFAGSGTTGVAALKLGRRAILIEKDPTYAAIARQRMIDTEEELDAMGGAIRTYTKPRQAGLFPKNKAS